MTDATAAALALIQGGELPEYDQLMVAARDHLSLVLRGDVPSALRRLAPHFAGKMLRDEQTVTFTTPYSGAAFMIDLADYLENAFDG